MTDHDWRPRDVVIADVLRVMHAFVCTKAPVMSVIDRQTPRVGRSGLMPSEGEPPHTVAGRAHQPREGSWRLGGQAVSAGSRLR